MTQWMMRHRRWAYLAYALGMLSIPFATGYIDSADEVRGLFYALIPLTLIAYGELFLAVEHGSLNYRKMTGNPDLLILADTQPSHTFSAMWWAWVGGWRSVTLIALIIGRFVVALGVSHYLHLYIPSSTLKMFAYVSHNGYYLYWWPVWWQMALAFGLLTVLALVESVSMIALATLIYTRVRRRVQWRQLAFVSARLVWGMMGLFGAWLLFPALEAVQHLGGYTLASQYPTYICYDINGDYAPLMLPEPLCRDILISQQIRRVGETAQIALITQLDGGILTAASVMRPHQKYRFRGKFLEYRPRLVNPNINSFSYQTTYWLISPWWLVFRMIFAGILSALLMRGVTVWLWRLARYR